MNAFAYAGHGEIRRRVIGEDDRAPTPAELDEMRALVRQAMNEGAFGLSTGLFYVPGYYATTEEVIELARVAAEFDVETMEMLAIRGGADKLLFADPRPALNGRTLAAVAAAWELPVPAAVRRILTEGNAAVMNLDLYDIENTHCLARQPWMMTCTDGRTPSPTQNVTHPRVFGAFTRKLRQFVLDERIIAMPFAIRSMTGLAADFLRLDDRGYLRAGAVADIAVFDAERIRDRATYDRPRQPSEGTVHVLVNGRFAIRDGDATGALAGRPIRRPARTDRP